MHLINTSLKLAALGAVLASSTFASLVIDTSSITGNSYSYSLSFDDLANSTKFNADVFSQSNVSVSADGSGAGERRYIAASTGATSASLVYKFDFTTAGYEASSVSFKDYILLNNTAIPTNSSTATTQWSVDGVNWTNIRTKTATGTQQTSNGTTTIDFANLVATSVLTALPDTVYYRVTFTSLSGTFIVNSQQWDRASPGTSQFTADFTLTSSSVPEPSTFALMAGVAGLIFVGVSRRRMRR
ncbi:MAG: PEP-CTERM sorting domain-containing protein [Opitutaceae bacterium]|jgi:hypothetical protein